MGPDEILNLILRITSESAEPKRDLVELAAELKAFDGESATADVDVDTDPAKTALTDLKKGFADFRQDLQDVSVRAGPFGLSLENLLKVVGVLVPLVVSLGAALIALGAAAGAAVAGVAALTVAAVAAAGPIAALAIGAAVSYKKASTALDDYRQALQRVHTATIAQQHAEQSLEEAERNSQRAVEELRRARDDARTQISDQQESALQAQADAEYNLTQAQAEQQAAQEALNTAREEAVRTLFDMKQAADGAAISEERAQIALKRARDRLQELKDAGVKGLDLQSAVLDVRQAEEDLQTARENGRRSQEDLDAAEQRGIHNSTQMVAARDRIEQANRAAAEATTALAKATEENAKAQLLTVHRDDQVRAARQRVAEADRAVTEQRQRLTEATRKLQIAERDAAKQRELSASMRPGGAARELHAEIKELGKAWREVTGPSNDRIFAGLTDGIDSFLPTLRGLKGEFTDLGGVIGDAFRELGKEFGSPVWERFFSFFTEAASKVVPLMTGSFIDFARILANIAKAAMPSLLRALRGFSDWLDGVTSSTNDTNRLGDGIERLVDVAGSVGDLFVSIGKAIVAVGRAALGPGQELTDWLSEGIDKWAEWAAGPEGQAQINKFFEDMIPLAKEIAQLLVDIVDAALKWSQLMAPTIQDLLGIARSLAGPFNTLLGIFASLPAPIRDVIGVLFLFRGPIGTIVGLIFKLKLLRTILGGESLLGGAGLLSGLSRLKDGLISLGTSIGSKAGGLISRIGGLSGALRAVPYVAAGAAALEYGDDLGKAAAGLFGFSDAAIAATEANADALGVLSDAIYATFQSLPKGLQDAVSKLKGNRGIRDLFSDAELQSWADRLATGGAKAARAWNHEVRARVFDAQTKEALGQSAADVASKIGDAFAKEGVKSTRAANHTARSIALAFGKIPESASTAIKALGDGLLAGLDGIAKSVYDSAVNVADAIARGLKDKLKIKSPSKVMQGIGQAVGDGIVQGMRDRHSAVSKEADDIFGLLNRSAAGAITASVRGHKARRHSGSAGQTTQHFDMRPHVEGGDYPDADEYVADLSRNLRSRGFSLA